MIIRFLRHILILIILLSCSMLFAAENSFDAADKRVFFYYADSPGGFRLFNDKGAYVIKAEEQGILADGWIIQTLASSVELESYRGEHRLHVLPNSLVTIDAYTEDSLEIFLLQGELRCDSSLPSGTVTVSTPSALYSFSDADIIISSRNTEMVSAAAGTVSAVNTLTRNSFTVERGETIDILNEDLVRTSPHFESAMRSGIYAFTQLPAEHPQELLSLLEPAEKPAEETEEETADIEETAEAASEQVSEMQTADAASEGPEEQSTQAAAPQAPGPQADSQQAARESAADSPAAAEDGAKEETEPEIIREASEESAPAEAAHTAEGLEEAPEPAAEADIEPKSSAEQISDAEPEADAASSRETAEAQQRSGEEAESEQPELAMQDAEPAEKPSAETETDSKTEPEESSEPETEPEKPAAAEPAEKPSAETETEPAASTESESEPEPETPAADAPADEPEAAEDTGSDIDSESDTDEQEKTAADMETAAESQLSQEERTASETSAADEDETETSEETADAVMEKMDYEKAESRQLTAEKAAAEKTAAEEEKSAALQKEEQEPDAGEKSAADVEPAPADTESAESDMEEVKTADSKKQKTQVTQQMQDMQVEESETEASTVSDVTDAEASEEQPAETAEQVIKISSRTASQDKESAESMTDAQTETQADADAQTEIQAEAQAIAQLPDEIREPDTPEMSETSEQDIIDEEEISSGSDDPDEAAGSGIRFSLKTEQGASWIFQDQNSSYPVYGVTRLLPSITAGDTFAAGLRIEFIYAYSDPLNFSESWYRPRSNLPWNYGGGASGFPRSLDIIFDAVSLIDFLRWENSSEQNGPYLEIGKKSELSFGSGYLMDSFLLNAEKPFITRTSLQQGISSAGFDYELMLSNIAYPELGGLRFAVRPFAAAYPIELGAGGIIDFASFPTYRSITETAEPPQNSLDLFDRVVITPAVDLTVPILSGKDRLSLDLQFDGAWLMIVDQLQFRSDSFYSNDDSTFGLDDFSNFTAGAALSASLHGFTFKTGASLFKGLLQDSRYSRDFTWRREQLNSSLYHAEAYAQQKEADIRMNLSGELSWKSSSSSFSFHYHMPFSSSFHPIWDEDQLGMRTSLTSELFDVSFGYLKRGFSWDIAHAPADLLSKDGTAMLYADAQLKLDPAVLGSSFSFTNLSTDPASLDIHPAFTVYAGVSLP